MIRRFAIEHDELINGEGYSPDLVKVLGIHQQLLLYFRPSGSTSFLGCSCKTNLGAKFVTNLGVDCVRYDF